MALSGLAGRHDARSRHRWLNRFQTVLLILTLVGIAAAAGSLLFGEHGLWLVLATCALTLLIEPVVASAMTLLLYGTRPLRSNEASVIWSLLRALTTHAGLPNTPVPYYVSSGIVNAFATGSSRLASIALTDGLPGWGNPEPSWLRTHTAAEDRIARLMELAPQPSQTQPF
jgi:Zn-dependent protease with chaperone function